MSIQKNDQAVIETTGHYRREAELAKASRMQQNRKNFEFYHLKQNFSHKLKGQSAEFIPRQAMAVEQIAQFLQQGLMDFGDFFSVTSKPGVKKPLFEDHEIRKLLLAQLDKSDFYNFVLDSLKLGLLGSVMISKVHGCYVQSPHFLTQGKGDKEKLLRDKDKFWQLKLSLVRQRNYFPDPTSEGLYKLEQIEMDMWALEQMVRRKPDVYEVSAFEALRGALASGNEMSDHTRAVETNQSPSSAGYRKRVKLYEVWGNCIDSQSGKLLHEKKVWLVANERFLLMKPQAYPSWLNTDPYVVAPLIRTPFSEWHKALMDAPTWLNQALNEIFNLIIDGGLQEAFGIKQVRENWLEDPSEIAEGIPAGTTLAVNAACPPGAKVLERVDSGSLSGGTVNAFNLASGEFNQSALQNDLRVGTLPPRAVKATEVVEASQSITSVFTGVAKSVEQPYVEKLLEKAWPLICQHFDEMDPAELKALLGDRRHAELARLSPKERFAQTVNGQRFRVFGITQTMNKIKDFRKLTTLLQSVSGNPQLAEAFIRKYDMTKLLGEIIKALDVNEDRIKHDTVDQAMNELSAPDASGGLNLPAGPDFQSQLPQADAEGSFEVEPGQLSGLEFAAG